MSASILDDEDQYLDVKIVKEAAYVTVGRKEPCVFCLV